MRPWFLSRRPNALEHHVERLAYEMRLNSSALIAAAIISGSGRAHSVHEALRVVHDVRLAMEPERYDPDYVSWAEKFDGSKRHV
jgi:hypothetical protein